MPHDERRPGGSSMTPPPPSRSLLQQMRKLARALEAKSERRLSVAQWCGLLGEAFRDGRTTAAPWRCLVEAIEDGEVRVKKIAGGEAVPERWLLLPAEREFTIQVETPESREETTLLANAPALAQAARPGDVLGDAAEPAAVANVLSTILHWFSDQPLLPGRTYRVVGCGGERPALVGKLKGRLDPEGLSLAAARLEKGETGVVELEMDAPIVFDAALPESPLSWLLLEDAHSGLPVGVAFIRFALRRAGNVAWQETDIDAAARARALGQRPCVLWFTGYSGSGKSTVASLLERRLHEMGRHTYLLDGDNIRHGLCRDLGFSDADRVENMRRVAEVARLFVDAGLIVIVSFISPFASERAWARNLIGADRFFEVFVDTPLEICEARDIKGLYAKARAGKIRNFTGIDSPYERPQAPDIHLRGNEQSPEEMVEIILQHLRREGLA